jgi:adenine-specific DNA methylase
MIPKECKRLAEVDFPIAVVSKHSAREKSIRHGHPSTLHLWWARRPLAACRAMLLGLLLPDPCDEHCPEDFKEKARSLLPTLQGEVGPTDKDLRKSLLKFIGDFANWDLSANQTWLDISRGLVKAVHPEEKPLVVDPFAGGGSIPLEALRLGCETFASDLNPVACLILKVMLEDIPRHGPALADELRKVGQQIKEEAEKELAEFYPPDTDGSKPIAYLWARTVRCESPNCGADIPLVRSFWLARKRGRKYALRYKVERSNGKSPYLTFEIFNPQNDAEVPSGTVANARAICPSCNSVLLSDRIKDQLSKKIGGATYLSDSNGERLGGSTLLVVIKTCEGKMGKSYQVPTKSDRLALSLVMDRLEIKKASLIKKGLIPPLPDEHINEIRPSPNARGLTAVTRYGIKQFGDLFTPRQKMSLLTIIDKINSIDLSHSRSPNILKELLAMAFGKLIMQHNAHCRWNPHGESAPGAFGRQALPMIWDFIELIPSGESMGSFYSIIMWISETIEKIGSWQKTIGTVEQSDAANHPLPASSASIWFTDPPYYDAVPYSDLSDFFYVWLKRILPNHKMTKGDSFDPHNPLTPKIPECVWNQAHIVDGKSKTPKFFEDTITKAFVEGRRILKDDGIATIVFAHKSTEGWEALLNGILNANMVILASWPITTEAGGRLNAQDAAALSASVHLVCRPRPDNASVGDWGDVLRELPHRVGDWMERLQSEGIRGADLVFACIGPALEIFSRYSKVETAEGREVKLAEYLEKVWEVVGRTALEQVLGTEAAKARNGAAGAVEEDARLTALFLWTLQSTNGEQADNNVDASEEDIEDDEDTSKAKQKGFSLVFDVVRRFAQPLGIHLPEWEGRIIETKKGVVRLFSIAERAKQLFGEDGAQAIADKLESSAEESPQLTLFAGSQEGAVPQIKGRSRQRKTGGPVSEESLKEHRGATTLDRVHAAMLLQASGRANALRALLKAEVERSPDFLRLSNALSALYPKGSEEKRLLDAMLLAVPR